MSTELQKSAPKGTSLTIRERLNGDAFKSEIARVLPSHLTAERMARVAVTALMKTPKLQQCTQESFFNCMLNLSQWGLEPDGRRAHLIPYENRKNGTVECQVIVDYKGIVELVFRSGVTKTIHADVVHRGDEFEYESGAVKRHVPWFLRDPAERPKERGEVYAVYCVVQLAGRLQKHEIMSVEEVEGIRKRSRSGNSGPWVTDWNEMAKKTVFRRASKWLPWSAEIRDVLEKDDDELEDQIGAPRQSRVRHSELNQQLAGSLSHSPEPAAEAPQAEDVIDVPVEQQEEGDAYEGDNGNEIDSVISEWEEAIASAKTKKALGELNEKLIGGETRLTNNLKLPLLGKINAAISALGK